MEISKRLKTIRQSKDMSVYKLSQLSGVSETHIRDLERGDRNPSFDTLSKLAKPMGMSLSELVNESDDIAFLNKEEKELIECYRMLSKNRADTLLAFLKTLM